MEKNTKDFERSKIDWMITLLPLGIILVLCILFFFLPEQSNKIISQIRFVLGDTFGVYYLIIGLGVFLISFYVAGSKYGNIVLGKPDEKSDIHLPNPEYFQVLQCVDLLHTKSIPKRNKTKYQLPTLR